MPTSRRWIALWWVVPAILLFAGYAMVRLPDAFLDSYNYETADRGFNFGECPDKGKDLDLVVAQFERYRDWREEPAMALYRTTKPDYSNPWLWYDIATHPRWQLPYLERHPLDSDEYWRTIYDNQDAAWKHSRESRNRMRHN